MLTCNDLSLRLGGKEILKDVSFSLRPHGLTVLVGRNGSGKSSLFACINQQHPYRGRICWEGQDLKAMKPRQRARTLALLPQSMPAPHIPAAEMAAFGRNPYLDFGERLTDRDRRSVRQALRDAGAEAFGERYVDTLSGGEQQRVALAMLLAQDTPLVALDEPTAHMDPGGREEFLSLLRSLTEEKGKTVLLILHDLTLAAAYADELLVLEKGELVFSGSREECLRREILEATFGVKRFTLREGDRERVFFGGE